VIAEGSFLPGNPISNIDLAGFVDTTDEWIRTRTGIEYRHYAAPEQLSSDMAAEALRDACKRYNIDLGTIDGIIVATTTPDKVFPATAALVQNKLKIAGGAMCFDVSAACAGFVYALCVADSMLKNSVAKRIAVIGAEKMSSLLKWDRRDTCVLFGDGAGVMILEAQDGTENGILGHKLWNFSQLTDILYVQGGTATCNTPDVYIEMRGAELFRHAVEKMSEISAKILQEHGSSIPELQWLIPHQANQRMMDALAERLSIEPAKVVSSISQHANTSSASIPLAFSQAVQKSQIRKGDLTLLIGVGAGLAVGGMLFRL
jgi:3-oxoacyl-[acyl-carrier-protein] synthase-3